MFTPAQLKKAADCPKSCTVEVEHDTDMDLLTITHSGDGFRRATSIPVKHHVGKGRDSSTGRERQDMAEADFLAGIVPWLTENHP